MGFTINETYNRFSIVIGVCSFLVGSCIYLLFRSTDLLMFQLFPNGQLPIWIQSLRNSVSCLNVPEWVRFSFPDGLWLFAYLLIVDGIWRGKHNCTSLFFLTFLPLTALLTELLQWFHVIPGIGDWMDFICYIISILIFLNIKYLHYEKLV